MIAIKSDPSQLDSLSKQASRSKSNDHAGT
jgi:hypothetical protein